ncbi:MAG: DUF5320 domain-containing protein [Deltaproteobacteria bacterium]|nr:DUF5320 domain-containing protein [Deltaproteobacteria bacterium]MBW1931313.1 DUF5320 domain-containing protein [Deltaproteobacteria bacterium]
MPRFDGTGPIGNGPSTGRGLGYCNPNRMMNGPEGPQTGQFPGHGRGMGLRMGLGRGQAGGRGKMMGRLGRGRRRIF